MRPVDKGAAPAVAFKKYQDAEPYLEERLGPYCSFCEMNIRHAPEVEHKEAKMAGGAWTAWGNLLLSCKYCNTRKGTKVKAGDLNKYLWPDQDDTFHTFSYRGDVPVPNEEYLLEAGDEIRGKAYNLYELVGLGNIPIKPGDKDRRYGARSEVRNIATGNRQAWEKVKVSSERDTYLDQIVVLALGYGFFSVWMEIFKDDDEVKNRLINAFRGTKKSCFKEK
ncbi:MAG: HNH endonuclease [Clostridiales bacterium]|nr:HNH endonuclease [Clostridiales bacterium]